MIGENGPRVDRAEDNKESVGHIYYYCYYCITSTNINISTKENYWRRAARLQRERKDSRTQITTWASITMMAKMCPKT